MILVHRVNELRELPVHCPYCNEGITVVVDLSIPEQEYVEDCQVCCRPIVLSVSISGETDVEVTARAENE